MLFKSVFIACSRKETNIFWFPWSQPTPRNNVSRTYYHVYTNIRYNEEILVCL